MSCLRSNGTPHRSAPRLLRPSSRTTTPRQVSSSPPGAARRFSGPCPERDGEAESGWDHGGTSGPTGELYETDNVTVSDDVESFVEREVRPASPTPGSTRRAAITRAGEVGLVGHEVNFNRYLLRVRPAPPPPRRSRPTSSGWRRRTGDSAVKRDGGPDGLGPGNGSRAD